MFYSLPTVTLRAVMQHCPNLLQCNIKPKQTEMKKKKFCRNRTESVSTGVTPTNFPPTHSFNSSHLPNPQLNICTYRNGTVAVRYPQRETFQIQPLLFVWKKIYIKKQNKKTKKTQNRLNSVS